MKAELEPTDVEQIAKRVIELIKPMILSNNKEADTVFDKKALSEYLKVDVTWIDHNLHVLPYFKAGKYTRFKRSSIDLWIKSNEKAPSPYLKLLEGRK